MINHLQQNPPDPPERQTLMVCPWRIVFVLFSGKLSTASQRFQHHQDPPVFEKCIQN